MAEEYGRTRCGNDEQTYLEVNGLNVRKDAMVIAAYSLRSEEADFAGEKHAEPGRVVVQSQIG